MSPPGVFNRSARFLSFVCLALACIALGAQAWSWTVFGAVSALVFYGLGRLPGQKQSVGSYDPPARSVSAHAGEVSPETDLGTSLNTPSLLHEEEEQLEIEEELTPTQKLVQLLEDLPDDYTAELQSLLREPIDFSENASEHTIGDVLDVAIAYQVPVDVLQALVQAGAVVDINRAESENWLSDFIEEQIGLDWVVFFLDAGVSPNGDSKYHDTLVEQALRSDQEDIALALIARGATQPDNVETDWVVIAIEEDHDQALCALLNTPTVGKIDVQSGLEAALAAEDEVALCYLLGAGADPLAVNDDDTNAVRMALEQGNNSALMLCALPLSNQNRWRMLGQCQVLSEDSDLDQDIEAWIGQLDRLDQAWQSGYGDPIDGSAVGSTAVYVLSNASAKVYLLEAQTLMLNGVSVFDGSNKLYATAVSKQSSAVVATYLESVSEDQAQQHLNQLPDAHWVHEVRAHLHLRRTLRSRVLAASVAAA